MCTLSFRLEPEGYELYFSRDERRSRAPASAPARFVRGGSRVVAPRDPEGGGTWLAVNEHGLTIALLNDYGAPVTGAHFESRGALVLGACGARDPSELERRLGRCSLARYRPFELLAFAPGEPAARFAWNGRTLELERGARGPFASSALIHSEARAARRARFAELCGSREPTAALLERFHREHAPARGALSACMHRSDAKTVSLARVRVTRARVGMAYAGGSPCRARLGPPLELARA